MSRKQYRYLLERINESRDWPKGSLIWAFSPCPGWRVIKKVEVR